MSAGKASAAGGARATAEAAPVLGSGEGPGTGPANNARSVTRAPAVRLRSRLNDPDPNVRIGACELIADGVWLARTRLTRVRKLLVQMLADRAQCQVAYAGFQCDDDETLRVCDAAAAALCCLAMATAAAA